MAAENIQQVGLTNLIFGVTVFTIFVETNFLKITKKTTSRRVLVATDLEYGQLSFPPS